MNEIRKICFGKCMETKWRWRRRKGKMCDFADVQFHSTICSIHIVSISKSISCVFFCSSLLCTVISLQNVLSKMFLLVLVLFLVVWISLSFELVPCWITFLFYFCCCCLFVYIVFIHSYVHNWNAYCSVCVCYIYTVFLFISESKSSA